MIKGTHKVVLPLRLLVSEGVRAETALLNLAHNALDRTMSTSARRSSAAQLRAYDRLFGRI